jgi:hypothetical protein
MAILTVFIELVVQKALKKNLIQLICTEDLLFYINTGYVTPLMVFVQMAQTPCLLNLQMRDLTYGLTIQEEIVILECTRDWTQTWTKNIGTSHFKIWLIMICQQYLTLYSKWQKLVLSHFWVIVKDALSF